MKTQNKAFTLVELLVVISIIALLLGLVIPATNHVMKAGRVAAMKATIHSVSVGVEQFKTDKGSYPVSSVRWSNNLLDHSVQIRPVGQIYISELNGNFIDVGTHHLAEAMFGLDKLGYSPVPISNSDAGPQDRFYSIDPISGKPVDENLNEIKRADVYLDPSKLELGSMNDAYNGRTTGSAVDIKVWTNPNPVILDKTNKKSPTPLLYFKANKRANLLIPRSATDPMIYDDLDNAAILSPYSFNWPRYIWDPKTGIGNDENQRLNSAAARPYNSDTFLLISGGPDGRFGTEDDITNFQRRE